jgi:hypothetical protein
LALPMITDRILGEDRRRQPHDPGKHPPNQRMSHSGTLLVLPN